MANRATAVLCLIGLVLLGSALPIRAEGPQVAWNTASGMSWFDPGDNWQASPVADDCTGPFDGAGLSWTDPTFDDSAWSTIQLPDVGSIPTGQDRYYRLHVRLSTSSLAEIQLSADDGVTLYANGRLVGTWGAAECHGEGVADNVSVDLTAYLRQGDNVLAMHASNGPGDALVHATLSVQSLAPVKIVPFLDLPYDYANSNFAVESGSFAQGGRVTAYFDHQSPGSCAGRGCSPSDTRAVHFYGYEGALSSPGQAHYQVYYNGHSGTDYALATGRAVLAAASGVVTFAGNVSSVCSDGQTRSAMVIRVLHANGYTTEYWHLSAFASGLEVGSSVNRDPAQPIGFVGATGCTTGPHLHFAVYSPSRTVVDPYAWSPRADTSWYGQSDPWRRTTGPYLWVQPLAATAVTTASSAATVYAPSASARVIVPPEAGSGPLRVEVAEGLPSVRIPNHSVLYLCSATAYTSDHAPVPVLGAEAFVDMRMGGRKLQVISESKGAPVILRWDTDSDKWLPLPTTWDRPSRVASAPTDRLGTFALGLPAYSYYLPALYRQIAPPEETPSPPAHLGQRR